MLTNKQILENFKVKSILKEFAKTGQKKVFLVENKDENKVILKLVNNGNKRVLREIEIVTTFNFDNVPKVLSVNDYDIEGETGFYIIEEFIQGEVLTEILKNNKLNISDCCVLAEQLLKLIVSLEKNKIVHRDIKPDNIIKGSNGLWYLLDFGIARAINMNSLTLTEMKMGPHTPGYAAPETFQYSKKDIDSRADLFSLGVVLYESITGEHPFIDGSEWDYNEIDYKTKTISPKMIKIEGDVDSQFFSLIETFMQKHISRRPRTAKKAYEWFLRVKELINGEVY